MINNDKLWVVMMSTLSSLVHRMMGLLQSWHNHNSRFPMPSHGLSDRVNCLPIRKLFSGSSSLYGWTLVPMTTQLSLWRSFRFSVHVTTKFTYGNDKLLMLTKCSLLAVPSQDIIWHHSVQPVTEIWSKWRHFIAVNTNIFLKQWMSSGENNSMAWYQYVYGVIEHAQQ